MLSHSPQVTTRNYFIANIIFILFIYCSKIVQQPIELLSVRKQIDFGRCNAELYRRDHLNNKKELEKENNIAKDEISTTTFDCSSRRAKHHNIHLCKANA